MRSPTKAKPLRDWHICFIDVDPAIQPELEFSARLLGACVHGELNSGITAVIADSTNSETYQFLAQTSTSLLLKKVRSEFIGCLLERWVDSSPSEFGQQDNVDRLRLLYKLGPFHNLAVTFAAFGSPEEVEMKGKDVRDNGGNWITSGVDASCTHLVVGSDHSVDISGFLNTARFWNVEIVRMSWLEESVRMDARQVEDDHRLNHMLHEEPGLPYCVPARQEVVVLDDDNEVSETESVDSADDAVSVSTDSTHVADAAVGTAPPRNRLHPRSARRGRSVSRERVSREKKMDIAHLFVTPRTSRSPLSKVFYPSSSPKAPADK